MRTRILIICGIVLALCLWVLLHQTSPKDIYPLETQISSINRQEVGKSTNMAELPVAVAPSPVGTYHHLITGEILDPEQQELEAWQKPIEFYGKAVDENSNSVVGVSVHFRWAEKPSEDGMQTSDTQSDSSGLFSLHGKHGASLTVSFGKDGYYASHGGQKGFNYALGPNILSPDPLHPIIFYLQKKGAPEPLIHIAGIGLHAMRDYLLSADGKSTEVSLHDGHLATPGQGDLQVSFQAGPQIDNYPTRISWQCTVTIPGGGLVQTSEEFPFLAPEVGYLSSDAWSVTVTNWTETVNQQYYVKLRDGNYGRVKLRVIGVPNGAYFRMESFLNPAGSRNLEPAP